MALLTESKEFQCATYAAPIGQKHKYESSPAVSAGTCTGLLITTPELMVQLISLAQHLRMVVMISCHIF